MRAVQQAVAGDVCAQVPLGQILGSSIWLDWRAGHLTDLAHSQLRVGMYIMYNLWVRESFKALRGRCRRVPLGLPGGCIAIEVLSNEPRIRRFWEPIARRLGAAQCILVLGERELRTVMPGDFECVVTGDLPIDWGECRSWFLSHYRKWLKGMSKVCAEFDLAPRVRWRLTAHLLTQIRELAEAHALARLLKPKAFLTTFDQNDTGAPLCSAMRSQGVPTYTLVHGALGRQNLPYLAPLNADQVLVWGEMQRDLFLLADVPESRIKIVGCQSFALNSLPGEVRCRELRKRIQFGDREAIVLVGFTMLNPSERAIWAHAVRRLAAALPEASLLCRLHPSDRRSNYLDSLPDGPRFRVMEAATLTLEESLALADVVVVDSSGFGFDALVHGKQVAVLDPYTSAQHQCVMVEVLEAGAALYSRDPASLADQIRNLWSDPGARRELQEPASRFIRKYVSAFGDEAAENIVNLLRAHVHGGAATEALLRTSSEPGDENLPA